MPVQVCSPRTDSRYEFPVTLEAFLRNNRQYTMRKLLSKRVDPEWATMQDELRTELAKGRMSGPYRAPDWWPVPTTTIDDMPLRPLPSQEISTSFCFSVVQSDKIRRCEDFRRSGHNATVIAHDVPHHHDIRTFTELALATPPGEEASPCVGTGPGWGLPTVSGTRPNGLLLRPHDTGRSGFAATPCHDLRGSEFCMELQQGC